MNDLERLLARPALTRLWTAARERLEQLGGARGSIRLEGASAEEQAAIAGLVGLRTLPGETVLDPVSANEGVWIEPRDRHAAAVRGYEVVDGQQVVIAHLGKIASMFADELRSTF